MPERDAECLRSAYDRCGCFALEFLFAFQHRAGGGIDVIFVFIPAGKEFHLVYRNAVVDIKVGFHTACRGSRNARVPERDAECIRSAYDRCGCFALEFLFGLQHCAGGGIDVIIVFIPAGKEFHFVNHFAVLVIHFDLERLRRGSRNARVLKRKLRCSFGADICAVARRAGYIKPGSGLFRAAEQKVQLVYSQLCKLFEAACRILRDQLVYQAHLSGGYVVFRSKLFQPVVRVDCLAYHARIEVFRAQKPACFLRKLLLQPFSAGGIARIHADKDGICLFVYIPVFEHGADKRIHRHIELCARKVHAGKYYFAVAVERLHVKHAVLAVDAYFHPGVHIERNRRVHRAVQPYPVYPQRAADQYAKTGCGCDILQPRAPCRCFFVF